MEFPGDFVGAERKPFEAKSGKFPLTRNENHAFVPDVSVKVPSQVTFPGRFLVVHPSLEAQYGRYTGNHPCFVGKCPG